MNRLLFLCYLYFGAWLASLPIIHLHYCLCLRSISSTAKIQRRVDDGRKYVSQIEGAKFQEEAYHLLITKKGILLEATTPKGMYWGRQTLEQLKTTKNKRYICHSVKSPTGLPSVSVASCTMWAEALSQ